MKNTFKVSDRVDNTIKLFAVLISLSLFFILIIGSCTKIKNLPLKFSKPYNEYNKILKDSFYGKELPVSLDLSSINSVEWDEVKVWMPNMTDCELGIAFKDGKDCELQYVNKAHIFLLKNLEVAAKIPANEIAKFGIEQKNSGSKKGALLIVKKHPRSQYKEKVEETLELNL